MDTLEIDGGLPPGTSQPWRNNSDGTGMNFFRIDLHEESDPTTYRLSEIRLAADHEADTKLAIVVSGSRDAAIPIYYRTSSGNETLIGTYPANRSSDVLVWNTSAVQAAVAAISELERLQSIPADEGASLADLKVYHKQQMLVLSKLEGLQVMLSDNAFGAVATIEHLKVLQHQTSKMIGEWVDKIDAELDEIPVSQIVASNPALSNEIEIIDIAHQGKAIALFRLRSHPAIAFPIWPLSKDRGGTQGRIYLRIPVTGSSDGVDESK
jgi:hypothetical protein